jgi:hypothetical protein
MYYIIIRGRNLMHLKSTKYACTYVAYFNGHVRYFIRLPYSGVYRGVGAIKVEFQIQLKHFTHIARLYNYIFI